MNSIISSSNEYSEQDKETRPEFVTEHKWRQQDAHNKKQGQSQLSGKSDDNKKHMTIFFSIFHRSLSSTHYRDL